MSINLKVLALASAALLALPATGYAGGTSASLDLVENSINSWSLSGSGFTSFVLSTGTLTGTPAAFHGSFTSPTSMNFSGTWGDTSDASTPTSSGKEFVVTSGSSPTVVAELNGQVSFTSTKGTFTGILYLGEAGPGDSDPSHASNVASVMDQGGVESIPFAADGSAVTIDTSAVPEPASIVVLGTSLLGLGATLRRRRRNADR